MGSNSIPPKTPSDESINRGLVCAHMHFITRTQKILTFSMNAGNKNTPSTHHARRRNMTTLMVGLKKRSHTQKSHPKVVNPRDIAGERKKKMFLRLSSKYGILHVRLTTAAGYTVGE